MQGSVGLPLSYLSVVSYQDCFTCTEPVQQQANGMPLLNDNFLDLAKLATPKDPCMSRTLRDDHLDIYLFIVIV